MNREELVLIMDRMATASRDKIDADKVGLWFDHLKGVEADVAADAAEDWIDSDTEGWFPPLGKFQGLIADVLRRRHREQDAAAVGLPHRSASCPRCAGAGWYEVEALQKVNQSTGEVVSYEQWKPCETCDPIAMDSWLRYRDERARAKRERPWEFQDDERVASYLGAARDALTPDPEPAEF